MGLALRVPLKFKPPITLHMGDASIFWVGIRKYEGSYNMYKHINSSPCRKMENVPCQLFLSFVFGELPDIEIEVLIF